MGAVKDILKKRAKNRVRLEKEAPNLYNGFNELMKHYYKPGALERKYKELMAVALSVATRCVPCLASHATNAIEAGATQGRSSRGGCDRSRVWWRPVVRCCPGQLTGFSGRDRIEQKIF